MSTLPSVLGVFVRFLSSHYRANADFAVIEVLGSVYLYAIFPECFRFCCLMAGAIYWAGFPQLWLSRFCSVSEPFEVNSNVLQGSCSVKPHLFDKSYCTKWNGKLGRWSVMMICFLLEFKRRWENSHALPSETAGSEGRYSSEFKLWWTMFSFLLQDTRWLWWDARVSTSLETSTATNVRG